MRRPSALEGRACGRPVRNSWGTTRFALVAISAAAAFLVGGCAGAEAHGAADLRPAGCPADAVVCFEAVNPGRADRSGAILTFGQPFAPGAVQRGSNLSASDEQERNLPLQVDATATHRDGSLRYAVLTVRTPHISAGGHSLIALRVRSGAPQAVSEPVLRALLPENYELEVQIDAYATQISQIGFGDRDGTEPGIPFQVGEQVALQIGDDPADRYVVTITSGLAGGGYENLTRLAEAFERAINTRDRKGNRYRAYKIGEGGGWEKLWITSRNSPGEPFDVKISYGGRARIEAIVLQGWEPRRRYTATVRAALLRSGASKGASGGTHAWLEGPLATELSLSTPFLAGDGKPHPRLAARFDVRVQADGRVRTDAAVENVWTYGVEPRNEQYDVTIVSGGSVMFRRTSLVHFHHARWHRVFWWDGAPTDRPALEAKHVPAALVASRAVPPYDLGLDVRSGALADADARMGETGGDPMGSGLITQEMPMAGGREDLGLLPQWDVFYLLTMDHRARAVALAQADAAGSAPIHYRDKATDRPVSLKDHPGIALQYGEAGGPEDALPTGSNIDTPWTLDGAHQPSLAYIAYLVTGDRYYLEELLFWANWNVGRIDPVYRDGAAGLVHADELRGQAWTLRTLANAAYIAPDRHPMKGYFNEIIARNIAWYVERYPHNPDPQTAPRLGFLSADDTPDQTAPWQNDFFTLVIGRLVEMGWEEARPLLDWTARFVVGRWTSEARGYCRAMAPAYWITVRANDGQIVDSWRRLFALNWPDVRSCPRQFIEGADPDSPIGYLAVLRATLAMLARLGHPGAAAAYEDVRASTPAIDAALRRDPTWAIAPRHH